ncbi:unannotated protein [freshwater metagenome]|uniref:Unannotated protein n=1 Tax=freshwater metagenome TaxID=449393 RepID=A0A6J7IN13_9ZZZZ
MSWCCGNCSKLRVKPHVISSGQLEPRGSARPSSACWRAQPMTLGSRRRRSRANSIFALKRLPLPSTSSSAAASSAAVPRAVVDHLTSQSPIRDELPSTPHGHRSSPSMSPLTCSSQRMQRALLPHSSPNCVRTWPRPDQRQRLADDVVEAAAAIVDHRHIAATQRRHRAINSTDTTIAQKGRVRCVVCLKRSLVTHRLTRRVNACGRTAARVDTRIQAVARHLDTSTRRLALFVDEV